MTCKIPTRLPLPLPPGCKRRLAKRNPGWGSQPRQSGQCYLRGMSWTSLLVVRGKVSLNFEQTCFMVFIIILSSDLSRLIFSLLYHRHSSKALNFRSLLPPSSSPHKAASQKKGSLLKPVSSHWPLCSLVFNIVYINFYKHFILWF